jgi:uncharacterized protein
VARASRPCERAALNRVANCAILDAMKVKCPTCKRVGDWFAGSTGPFCSRRCKLVDLGKWFSEEHAISDPLRPEHLEKFAELPPGEHLDKNE